MLPVEWIELGYRRSPQWLCSFCCGDCFAPSERPHGCPSCTRSAELILRLIDAEGLEPTVLGETSFEIPEQYLDRGKARRMLDHEWLAGRNEERRHGN